VAPDVDEALVHLGFDAQTSGGLLLTVAPARLASLQRELTRQGVPGFVIGQLLGPSRGQIELTRSAEGSVVMSANQTGPEPSEPIVTPIAAPVAEAHDPGCCAGVSQTSSVPGSAAEAQRAFGAMMRAVQAGGVLDVKVKELIQFSLVLLSRCGACFEAHYEKARAMGLTQAELDEAAWCAIVMGGAPVRMFYQEQLRRCQEQPGWS
jgi:AhpD family alkylhydroperoxidase